MEFGLFFEISVPRPWVPGIEHRVFQNALEQARLADELGFKYIWAVEHHFLEEYSHCSAPELFLTAVAMQTRHVRVGHGIAVCVPQINHPVRMAERAAVLDLLSDGRLEFGTGRSSTWTELGGFGASPDDTKQIWDEYVRVLPKMWTQERFEGHDGFGFSIPPRAVLPKPYQKPHPPMWVAVSSPGTELDAADRGLGSLGITFVSFAEQERKVNEYRRRIRSCEPAGEIVNDRVTTVSFMFCHQDCDYGVQGAQRMGGMFNYMAEQTLSARQSYPSRYYASQGLLPSLRRNVAEAPQGRVPEGLTAGDPERIIQVLRNWEATGVDHVNFMVNSAEVLSQEEVLASLRLFAREVMPKFQPTPQPAAAAAAGE